MGAALSPKQKAAKEAARIITPEFRVSYPHLFKPNAPKPTDKPKYSVTMLFPKDSDLAPIKEAIRNAKIAAYGSKDNWPEKLESPVNDGDDPKYADKKGYKGHWVIKASTNEDQRPGVVDETGKNPITEQSKLYPGCYARACVYATKWEYMKKEGIMFILDHVQKMRDGEAFGGKKPADQVFGSVAADDDDDTDTDDTEDFT